MTLRLCSIAARGLWIEMLAIMGISERYGYLQIGGKVITEKQLAVMAGCSIADCVELLRELEQNGVFSRDDKGIPFCRRMVREHLNYEQARLFGERGGNPSLRLSPQKKLEARSYKLEATNGLTPTLNPTLNQNNSSETTQHQEDWTNVQDSRGASEKETQDHSPARALLASWLTSIFSRPADSPWSYEEERLLVEVSCRSAILTEIDTLKKYWLQAAANDEKLPRSISRTLGAWNDLLDRARTPRSVVTSKEALRQKRINPAGAIFGPHTRPEDY